MKQPAHLVPLTLLTVFALAFSLLLGEDPEILPPSEADTARWIASGDDSTVVTPMAHRVSDAKTFASLYRKHAGKSGDLPKVSFKTHEVIMIFLGQSTNTNIPVFKTLEHAKGYRYLDILLRYFQTDENASTTTPYLFVAIPRHDDRVRVQFAIPQMTGDIRRTWAARLGPGNSSHWCFGTSTE